MSNLWYNNPQILLDNWMDFFPTNNLSREAKINAIARFAIYYAVLIFVFKQDSRWFAISIVLLMISYYLGYYEDFEEVKKTEKCVGPTKKNPFMNFTLDDFINNKNRKEACPYDKAKDKMRSEFRKDIIQDPADLWGQNISDRQFFTMPWTTIVNDQTGLGKWLYGKAGECKNLGLNCDKNRDNRYHHGRYYVQY